MTDGVTLARKRAGGPIQFPTGYKVDRGFPEAGTTFRLSSLYTQTEPIASYGIGVFYCDEFRSQLRLTGLRLKRNASEHPTLVSVLVISTEPKGRNLAFQPLSFFTTSTGIS